MVCGLPAAVPAFDVFIANKGSALPVLFNTEVGVIFHTFEGRPTNVVWKP